MKRWLVVGVGLVGVAAFGFARGVDRPQASAQAPSAELPRAEPRPGKYASDAGARRPEDVLDHIERVFRAEPTDMLWAGDAQRATRAHLSSALPKRSAIRDVTSLPR
jgi:hypothetical protein